MKILRDLASDDAALRNAVQYTPGVLSQDTTSIVQVQVDMDSDLPAHERNEQFVCTIHESIRDANACRNPFPR